MRDCSNDRGDRSLAYLIMRTLLQKYSFMRNPREHAISSRRHARDQFAHKKKCFVLPRRSMKKVENVNKTLAVTRGDFICTYLSNIIIYTLDQNDGIFSEFAVLCCSLMSHTSYSKKPMKELLFSKMLATYMYSLKTYHTNASPLL